MYAKKPRRHDAKVNRAPRWAVLLLAGVMWAAGANADHAETTETSPQLMEQLRQLGAKAAEVIDLESRFVQRRYAPLLRKPIESDGTVRARAGVSRWDTQEPYASVMLIERGRLSLYDPERRVLEVYPLERRLGELAASPIPRLATWVEHFAIESVEANALSDQMREEAGVDDEARPSVLVRLTPKDAALAEQVGLIVAVIDVESGLSRAMVWSSGEGERTEIVFADTRINSGLKPEDLAIELPDGTRVVYPAGPVEEAGGAGGE